MKKIYASIPLILLGIYLIKTQFIFEDGCTSFLGRVGFMLAFIAYVLYLLLVLGISLIQYLFHKHPFNFYPLLTSIVVFLCFIFAFIVKKSGTEIIAYTMTQDQRINRSLLISLKRNNKFLITERGPDRECNYLGQYTMEQDTITLLREDIQILTDSALSNVYVIAPEENKMYPIDRYEFLQDTGRSLKILSRND